MAIRAGEILAGAAHKQAQQAAHDAIENMRARAAARIANTAGGRLAQSIRQSQLSRGEPPAAGEVDAFRDGGGSIGAPASADTVAGRGSASERTTVRGTGARPQDDLSDPTAGASEEASPSAEIRGGHQPTGVVDDEDTDAVDA